MKTVGLDWSPRSADPERSLVITMIRDRSHEARLAESGLRCVNVAGKVPVARLPSILGDGEQEGRLAADHLILRSVDVFVGLTRRTKLVYCEQRLGGFEAGVGEHGGRFLRARLEPDDGPQRYASLMRRVRKEVDADMHPGVYAVEDSLAALVIEQLLDAGLRVPHEVAVLGTGNNRFITELGHPQITSVMTACEQRGYEAVRLLRRMGTGHRPAPTEVRLPPAGISIRESTEYAHIRDPEVAAALHFIRRNAHKPIGVEDVMEQAACSRRKLEMAFRKVLCTTIHEAIWQAHVNLAKRLLENADLNLLEVAIRSGFSSAASFSTVFRRRVGTTPNVYRANITSNPGSVQPLGPGDS